METLEQLKKNYEIGLPVLEKLFKLNKQELLPLLKKICEGIIPDHYNHLFEIKNAQVTKVTVDDEANKITVNFYDCLEITPLGIYIQPEHGDNQKIISFNETFTLDKLL